jgi:hypothetical protein
MGQERFSASLKRPGLYRLHNGLNRADNRGLFSSPEV